MMPAYTYAKRLMFCIFPSHQQLTSLGPRSFPLTGLNDLEPEWQEAVIEIITKPPVNQILKVSSYTLKVGK